MHKLIQEVRNAATSLRMVARGLRIPLDTTRLDKAVDALEAECAKDECRRDEPTETGLTHVDYHAVVADPDRAAEADREAKKRNRPSFHRGG